METQTSLQNRSGRKNSFGAVKESLSEIRERFGNKNKRMNWKSIVSLATAVGTVGLALSRQLKKNKSKSPPKTKKTAAKRKARK